LDFINDLFKNFNEGFKDIKDELLNLLTYNDESVENANQLMTTYLSISDQKNNEVVRLLTIFSAFFLPLTFIAGVYGMNFDFMPELNWKWGYFFSIGFMLLVVIVIYLWFRRKRIL
jgi:magnesium transporter